jgi:primosomal protein N' (replication factor Y)
VRVTVATESLDAPVAHVALLKPCEALGITLLGPAPAPVEKVRNYWRFHILFKAQSAAKLQNLMLRLKRDSAGEKNARIVFDLDPQDML